MSAATVCELGHHVKAMECPACSGTEDLAHWRWYKGRTSSKRIKPLVQAHIDRVIAASRLVAGNEQTESNQ